jgi:hypothetical protein
MDISENNATRIMPSTILALTIIFICHAQITFAQTNELEELKLENIKLKNRIQELESVDCPKTTKYKKSSGNPWHSLKVNISKAEVTSLLGKPGKIDKWKTGEAWYYPDSRGGEVDFDINGKVTGWLEP